MKFTVKYTLAIYISGALVDMEVTVLKNNVKSTKK